VVDVFSGMLPALLPKIREDYGLSRTRVIILLTVMSLVCNGTQIATGNLRARKRGMLFLPVGLLLSAVLCLMALAPRDGSAEYWFYMMVVVSGIGIAIVHPEGLRAVHGLEKIPGSICTAVFMMGGFFGFAAGAWISTELVMWRGGNLEGLYYLIPAAVFGFVVLWLIKIRLSLEEDHENGSAEKNSERLPFRLIFVMAVPAAISTTLIMSLLPTRLVEELHFELTFGGFSGMTLVGGGVMGSVFWAWLAHRFGYLLNATASVLLGIPFFLVYLAYIDRHGAVWLLAAGGFCTIAAYPLLVTLAKWARGVRYGLRLGLMVGGTWGVAGLFLAGMGPIADKVGVQPILRWFWLGYLISGVGGIWVLYQIKVKKRWKMDLPNYISDTQEEMLSGLPNA